MSHDKSAAFGVYVHVPFCRHRCDYCAFATYTDRDHLMGRYVDACRREIEEAGSRGARPPATSVFFGGGTPSRLGADALARILDAVELAPGAEVTVECNPEDADEGRFARYRSAGVTRLSFGGQSTRPAVLAALGRRHRPGDLQRALRLALDADFASFNVDLIFGAVGESDDDWARTLDDVVSFDAAPPHVSAYALTVEPGTPLARDRGRHPDEDVLARRYELAEHRLTEAGYRWEEISNWARPGHECRHHDLYWSQGDYLGFGSAAHSHVAGHRWWNVRTPDRYVAAVESGRSPVAADEHLDPTERRFERLALALRTRRGVPATVLKRAPELEGLVHYAGGRAVLTVAGRLLANDLTARLDPSGLDAEEPVGTAGILRA